MRAERKTPWLTMRQAAALIGWTDPEGGRRLKWRLMTVQRRQRCRVLIPVGRGAKRQHYVTSETLMHRWCPELFATAAHLPMVIQERFAGVDAAASATRNRLRALGSENRAIYSRLAAIEARLDAARI